MDKIIDLSKAYLPIVLVVGMLVTACSVSFWLSSLASNVEQHTKEIKEIGKSLEVLPKITTDIALIKHELGIDDSEIAVVNLPYRDNLD